MSRLALPTSSEAHDHQRTTAGLTQRAIDMATTPWHNRRPWHFFKRQRSPRANEISREITRLGKQVYPGHIDERFLHAFRLLYELQAINKAFCEAHDPESLKDYKVLSLYLRVHATFEDMGAYLIKSPKLRNKLIESSLQKAEYDELLRLLESHPQLLDTIPGQYETLLAQIILKRRIKIDEKRYLLPPYFIEKFKTMICETRNVVFEDLYAELELSNVAAANKYCISQIKKLLNQRNYRTLAELLNRDRGLLNLVMHDGQTLLEQIVLRREIQIGSQIYILPHYLLDSLLITICKYTKLALNDLAAMLQNDLSPVEFLGAGSFGHVYKATDPSGKHVAVKLPRFTSCGYHNANAISILNAEASIGSQIEHPHIVRFISSSYSSGSSPPIIAFEFLEEGDMENYISANLNSTTITKGEAKMARCIGLALEYLQSKGFIHQDIKPENCLLMRGGGAKLGDFGSALKLTPAQSLSIEDINCGTNMYMGGDKIYALLHSAKGSHIHNHNQVYRCDVDSLVLTLYALWVKLVPYQLPTKVTHTAQRHYINNVANLRKQRPPLGRIADPNIHRFFQQAWHPDPQERSSLAQINEELYMLSEQADPATTPEMPFYMNTITV